MGGKWGNEDRFSRNLTAKRRCGIENGFLSFLTLIRIQLTGEFKYKWYTGLLTDCFRAGGDRIQIMREKLAFRKKERIDVRGSL